MAGLLNAKQLVDGSVTPNKLSERYLQVNEEGEVYGDLIVTGNTTLSETATYKGSEIATKGDLYDEGGINDLINELDEKKQDNLIAGENIQIAPDGVTISSSTKVANSDRVLTYDTAGLKANISLVVEGNHIRVEGKTDESGKPYILGEFNVLQSQIIDNVYIENGHLFITFIVDGNPGKEKVDVDLSEFIDIYEGSDYIDINGQRVSLKYSEVRDQLINDGMALTEEIPMDYVTVGTGQKITGTKTFDQILYANKDVYSGGKKSISDGVAGVFVGGNGKMYLCASENSSITFMPGNSINSIASIDTTIDRVINLHATGGLTWNGAQLARLSDIPSLANYVTLDTIQTISSVKTFINRPYLTNTANSNAFVIFSDLNSYLTTTTGDARYIPLTGTTYPTSINHWSGRQNFNATINYFSYRPYVGDINSTSNQVALISDIPTIPSRLANPNTLTFTGAVNATYDGSAPVTVNIPEGGNIDLNGVVKTTGDQFIYGRKTFMDIGYFNNGAIHISSNSALGGYLRADSVGLYTDGILSATKGIGTANKRSSTDGQYGEYLCGNGILVLQNMLRSEIIFKIGNQQYSMESIWSDGSRITVNTSTALYVNSKRVLTTDDLPSFNTASTQSTSLSISEYKTISNSTKLELGETTDIRYTNTEHQTGTLNISGGVDGKKYQYSINNEAELDLKLTLPNGKEWVIAAGEVGILEIYYLFDKYICRIV